MSNDKEKTLDHDYDGIKECDNLLPKWWLNIFYITIIFSGFYLFYYHISGNEKTQTEMLDAQLALEAVVATPPPEESFKQEELASFLQDSKRLASGKEIFLSKCISCHGGSGEGGIGPNLTDEYWIHGGKIHQIAKVVSEGILDKGMVAWKTIISRDEVISVAVYVKSLAGTKPANPKVPQGEKETP